MTTTPRFTYLKMQVAFLSGSACVGRSDDTDEVPRRELCPFIHLGGAKMEIAEDPMIGGSNLNEKTGPLSMRVRAKATIQYGCDSSSRCAHKLNVKRNIVKLLKRRKQKFLLKRMQT